MKQPTTQDDIVWQMPIESAENNSTGYVHGNAKIHAFVVCADNLVHDSLCKKYSQCTKQFGSFNIEAIEEKQLCKKCLNSYKKLKKKAGNIMYNIYNKETGELLEQQVDEQRLIDFANEELAETDNLEDAIENDLLFYDNAHDAQESLEAFGFTVEEV